MTQLYLRQQSQDPWQPVCWVKDGEEADVLARAFREDGWQVAMMRNTAPVHT